MTPEERKWLEEPAFPTSTDYPESPGISRLEWAAVELQRAMPYAKDDDSESAEQYYINCVERSAMFLLACRKFVEVKPEPELDNYQPAPSKTVGRVIGKFVLDPSFTKKKEADGD